MTTKKTTQKAEAEQNELVTVTSAKSDVTDHAETIQKLEALSDTLQADLNSINSESAFELIDEWHILLQKTKAPDSKEIASGLKELQKLLKRKDTAGHALGELLSHLGEQTGEIATKADKGLKIPLQHLGKQLSKVGKSLAKAEDQSHIEGLDSLVETLDQDAKEIDAEAAMTEIDNWYTLLQKSENENLVLLANDLKELKQMLKGSKTKATDLSHKLIQLGEQTTVAADDAARGFKGVIKTLGKALKKLGESIE